MIRALTCMLIITLTPLYGCADPTPPTDTSVAQFARDDESGVSIETRINTDEIILADRIWVDDIATWTVSKQPVFEPRDWVDTQWTVIEETTSPPELRDGVYSIHRSTLIEPFLPGTYTVPASVVRVHRSPDAEPTLVSTKPIEVQVLGVLTENDSGELNAIPDLTQPMSADHDGRASFVIAGIAIVVVSLGFVIVMLRRNTNAPTPRSVFELLRDIQSDPTISTHEGFERLGRIFDRLDPRLQSTTEFDQMIRVCDQARYSKSTEPGVRVTPQKMAEHALELLGDDVASVSRGGAA